MQTQGLFVPLLIGSALAAVAALLNTFMLIVPRDIVASRSREREEMGLLEADDNDYEDAIKAPDVLNKKHFVTIIVGALADNIGSAGLNPLCLSPPFYGPRVGANRTYVHEMNMPVVAYKWISILVALMVMPGVIVSPSIYNRIGLAGGCVVGSIVTGVVTIALLYIALAPPTSSSFAVFVTIFFCSFPFAVVSQLSTGPMLEAVFPVDKRGFCQGFDITVTNFGAALTPFLLGLVSDTLGASVANRICAGVSFLSAAINGCNIPTKPVPKELRPLKGEDTDLVEKALLNSSMRSGVPTEVEEINQDAGEWFKDCLVDNGYTPHLDSVLIKQAIMFAFPVLGKTNDEGFTPENIEQYLLSCGRLYQNFIENEGFEETNDQSFTKVLSNARSAMLQQNI
ncbi:hypothetical protein ACHAXN_001686 [Cyclotella atomus]